LERECSRRKLSGLRLRTAVLVVEPLPAGLFLSSPGSGTRPGTAALGRVKAVVADLADQQRAVLDGRVFLRAPLPERDSVIRAGERDRGLPGEFPASAELILDVAAVARQAAGAVADPGGEQPVVGLRP